MNARQKAFNEHFKWWKKVNSDFYRSLANRTDTKEEIALAAAASAWNAALAWAAKQIGE